MKHFLFIVTWFSICLASNAQCPEHYMEELSDSFIIHENIYFGENIAETGELYTLLMDVYEPVEQAGANGNGELLRPLVILLHGGSFTGGDKKDGEVRWICEDLARHGIVAASINYRTESNPLSLISEESMVKAVVRSVEDAKAGIRFFYKDVEEGNEYSIDPETIVLGGSSAGSICALHTVFMDEFGILKPKWKRWIRDLGIDTLELNGTSGNPGYSDDIIGIINISGAIANLDFLDNNSDLPILSIHNTGDLTIPYQYGFPYFIPTLPIVAGSRAIHTRMLANDANTTLLTFDAINHVPHTEFITGEQLFPEYYEVRDEILRFLGSIIPCDALPTSILENTASTLEAFPNPSTGFIFLKGLENETNEKRIEFDIYDGSGKLIGSDIPEENNIIVLPYRLANGLYYLLGSDRTNDDRYLLKVVISR